MGTQEKMLKMQMQVRENAAELQDYLRDLDNWESDIKKQDKTFSKMKPKQEKQLIAPIRNMKTAKKKHEQFEKKLDKKPKRIKSYDFKSWDKLDVDKMLDDIDAKDEEKEQVEYAKKQDKMESNLKILSMEEKDKGNKHFKASQYEKAIECYTKGMQHDPTSPILPANRAMAYLKVQKYIESEADCTLSLSLDPTYVKAYLRRGSARDALGKVESAIRDFKDALKLEPDNKQAKQELESIEKRNLSPKLTNNSAPPKPVRKKPGLVQPIKKPFHLQSKKPLRRIKIEEIGCAKIQETSDPYSFKHESELEESVTNALRNGDSKPLSVSTPGNMSCDVVEMKNPGETRSASLKKEKPSEAIHDGKSINQLEVPSSPSTCFQFQADVRKLKLSPESLAKYLLQLTPPKLPQLLKDQLDTDMLMTMVAGFNHSFKKNEEFIIDFMHHLTLAKRFDMAIMFCSSKNKADLRLLFDELLKNVSTQSSRIKQISSSYGI